MNSTRYILREKSLASFLGLWFSSTNVTKTFPYHKVVPIHCSKISLVFVHYAIMLS